MAAAESAPEDDDGGDGGGDGGGGGQTFSLHALDVDGFEPEQYESDTTWPSDCLHVTDRVSVPPPQVAEHDDHRPVTYEYVRHSCVLHD